MRSLWGQCQRHFSEGLEALREIPPGGGERMIAIALHCNLARLVRLCAESVAVLAYSGTVATPAAGANRKQRRELTGEEKGYYMQVGCWA